MSHISDHQDLRVLPFLTDGTRQEQNIYQAIGVEPIINCRGTFTIIGGSVERPEVLEAMDAASGFFVQYDELASAVGQHLAALTGASWGLIAAGCAAGIKHVTIACVTGGNPESLIRIPNLSTLEKTQVIIPRSSRNAYDHAVRNVGVEIVMVETMEELEAAINPRTAMIYTTTGNDENRALSLQAISRIAEPRGIPILADAAAENLTIPNVHLEQGATVVAYSGGKALCGPQCAGLVLGRKNILEAAWQASSPHHGPGRDDKIGKEEIIGMLAAVEAWITRDHKYEWQTWLARLQKIAVHLADIPSLTTSIDDPSGLSNRAPTLSINWDTHVLNITGQQVAEDFARNQPRIAIGDADTEHRATITVTPSQMQPGNEEIVAERIRSILTTERPPLSGELATAATNISGTWEVELHFAVSSSQHLWSLTQQGNWVSGSHKTDFELLSIHGVVEVDEVKLESHIQRPGNSIPFLFNGKIREDSITGSVYMGEYQTATFSGRRRAECRGQRPVTIPSGPPLAT